MTEIIAAKIQVDSSDGKRSVKEFREEIAAATQNVEDLTEKFGENSEQVQEAKKKVDGLNNSLKGTSEAGEKGSSSLGRVGKALQMLGIITIIVKGFEYFQEVLGKNQVTANALATVMKTLDIVFNDLINFVIKNAPAVVKFFKDIFENPSKYVAELGTLIKENLIERVNSLIKVFGYLGDVIGKVFKGDFKGAMESGKKAGVEFVDVMTGVNNSVERGGKLIKDAASAVGDYAKNTYDAASAQVALENKAKLALATLQGLIEQYDREAELQRQLRDNTNLSYEERYKASQKLKGILEDQEQAQLRLANLEVQRARTELSRNQSNVDLQIALQDALNEEAGIRAQITGLRSEQMQAELQLLDEYKTAQKENLDMIASLDAQLQAIKDENAKKDKDRFDTMVANSLEAAVKEVENLQELEKTKEELRQASMESERQKVDFLGGLAEKASVIAGQQTTVGKGLAVAQATMDTYAAANDALKANYGPFGPFALAAKVAAVATTIGMGLKNVANIVKVKAPGVSGGGSAPSGSAPAPLQPLVQTSTLLQADQLNKIGNAAEGGINRAYVVTSDVSSSQERQAMLSRAARLGS